jgi:hypothetical protein
MIFVATKNVRETKFPSSFGAVFGSGIRDKNPESATLLDKAGLVHTMSTI